VHGLDNKPTLPYLIRNIGGVPLGSKMTEDIFGASRESGMKKSTVGPRL
jgi:hypothetical protein